MKETDDNILAVFMGGVITSCEPYDMPHGSKRPGIIYYWKFPPEVKSSDIGIFHYKNSYDWLMEVVEKIKSICLAFKLSQNKNHNILDVSFMLNHIAYTYIETTRLKGIEGIYKLVVGFVKWYNIQKDT